MKCKKNTCLTYCVICEKGIAEDEEVNEYSYEGEPLCGECAEELYKCNGCEKYFAEGEVEKDSEYNCYCKENCADSNTPDYEFNGNSDWWRCE